MRSRYQHDGSVDDHAHSEHEILRRADEALEHRRLAEQAATVAEHHSALGAVPLLGQSASVLGGAPRSAAVSAEPPRMPHENFHEQLGLNGIGAATKPTIRKRR